ncbi:DUF3515 family protein [Microbacterium album]|uniref:DUF3515 domain-containing protein n=1 Tax=Microbacterium album TaxID=2053191 RepID=A0A917IFW4_9MICO|nr:DUF3515 family protein [Microbacterium album]GGH39724.1 hypothetical protein GCM10010921_11150 [Microbacterium album]
MIRRLVAAAAAAVLLGLTGCAATVSLPAADDANDPLCAEVSVRLPSNLGGLDRRWTDAQAAGAWGAATDVLPATVMLRCGVTPPGPTTLQCVTFEGVDWIVDASDLPMQRITTYGRTPATQLYVDTSVISPSSVLPAISRIVSALPAETHCVDPDEATIVPEADEG